MRALYVHVPFCAQVCHYCDFAVLKAPPRMFPEYVALLSMELRARAPHGLAGVRTAYLGGGTPSVLPSTLLEGLLEHLREQGLSQLDEFTMEFNPEQVDAERIAVARRYGVDRFSLGLQSLDDALLRTLGRRHDSACALDAWEALRSAGFRSGSVDLMFDLPGQTLSAFLEGVERVLDRRPAHVSFYGLGVEPTTLMGQKVAKGEWQQDDSLYAPMYTGAIALLQKQGLNRYEVSNCALPGHESVHNRAYWQRIPYLGVGPGAHSFLDGVRSAGPSHYARWKDWVLAGCPTEGLELDVPDASGQALEKLWLALRCAEGLDVAAYNHETGQQMSEAHWSSFVERGWLVLRDGRLCLEGDGWLWMDTIVTTLRERLER